MKLLLGFWLAVISSLSLASPVSFEYLLDEAGMRYQAPEGFSVAQIEPNDLLSYEHAVRDPEGRLEVRYLIRPIQRLEIDYDDPHNPAPDPNDMFRMLFDTLSGRLSGGRYNPDKTLHPEEARNKFHADWAALSVFDVEQSFSGRYRQALFLAMHKDQQADAYVVFLFNDYDQVRDLVNANLASLSFLHEESAPTKKGRE